MGRALISPAGIALKPRRFSSIPQSSPRQAHQEIASSFRKNVCFSARPARCFPTRAVLSDFPNTRKYPRVGAESTGPVPAEELLGIVEHAAKIGAGVVMDAVNKPQNINYKGATDLVTEWDDKFCTLLSKLWRINRSFVPWKASCCMCGQEDETTTQLDYEHISKIGICTIAISLSLS